MCEKEVVTVWLSHILVGRPCCEHLAVDGLGRERAYVCSESFWRTTTSTAALFVCCIAAGKFVPYISSTPPVEPSGARRQYQSMSWVCRRVRVKVKILTLSIRLENMN